MASTMRRLTITVDKETEADIRAAADEAHDGNVSAFLVEAAKERLRVLAMAESMREWEADNGAFSEAEMAEAQRRWFD